MQQQQCRSRWSASFSIEDVDAVDIDDTVSWASHGFYSSVLVRGSLWIRKHSSFAGKARADRLQVLIRKSEAFAPRYVSNSGNVSPSAIAADAACPVSAIGTNTDWLSNSCALKEQ